MRRKVIVVLVGSALVAGICLAFGTVNRKVTTVSLIQLIANPDKYHGKPVRVIGVARIEFEGNGIWFTKEHYKHRVYKNSLWIEPDYKALGATPKQLKEFNGKYVLMEGIFNKDDKGHMGMNSGALEKVTRYDLWEEGTQTGRPATAPDKK